ncbi:MAG: aspartate-semialdehyde dehydrogenase [Pseudomonadota bacterium]
MSRAVNVAVVGATGLVGETMLSVLEQRQFATESIVALASERSAGNQVMHAGKNLVVQDLAKFDFSKTDIALFSAGGSVSKIYAPKAAAAGAVVVDNTSCFRYDKDIPLVVPEVNPDHLASYTDRGIIANPNCSTIQMVVALKPIYDAVGISRINVATYQAVSGAGRSSVEKLAKDTAQLLNGQGMDDEAKAATIAFNAVPHIDMFQDNGYTKEEMKMVWETRKIMGDESIQVNPTAVRVPVFFGHSMAVHIETIDDIEIDQVNGLLDGAPGIELVPHFDRYPTAVADAADNDPVYVGRVRKDISHPKGLNLWVVADNVRKGAALNSVQIAEILVKDYL